MAKVQGNKLLGFKLEPKTGQRIEITPLVSPETLTHEITNKHIKALITARKREKAGNWTIKHELETLRGAIQLARDLFVIALLDTGMRYDEMAKLP